jgi:hypothetical protein
VACSINVSLEGARTSPHSGSKAELARLLGKVRSSLRPRSIVLILLLPCSFSLHLDVNHSYTQYPPAIRDSFLGLVCFTNAPLCKLPGLNAAQPLLNWDMMSQKRWNRSDSRERIYDRLTADYSYTSRCPNWFFLRRDGCSVSGCSTVERAARRGPFGRPKRRQHIDC